MKSWTRWFLMGAAAMIMAAAPVDVNVDETEGVAINVACADAAQGCKPLKDWVCFGKDKDYPGTCPLSNKECEEAGTEVEEAGTTN